MLNHYDAKNCRKMILGTLVAMILFSSNYRSLGTAISPLPTRPTPAFPPRPVPPSPTPTLPLGAGIELRVHTTRVGLWSIVQWQDGLGKWHDVEGWRGGLNERNRQIWWVSPQDMGTGPFRWLVLDGEGGDVLTASEPFYLPAVPGQLLIITPKLEHTRISRGAP